MSTVTVEIKSRWNEGVLFRAEVDASTDASLRVRAAVVIAVNARANLAWADLAGADLGGADLAGASLDDNSVMVGERPILQIGPIGSASRYFVAYLTDKGLRLRTGCFFGSCKQFEDQLAATHGDNLHAQEYRAALALVDAHARLWTPDASEQEAA